MVRKIVQQHSPPLSMAALPFIFKNSRLRYGKLQKNFSSTIWKKLSAQE